MLKTIYMLVIGFICLMTGSLATMLLWNWHVVPQFTLIPILFSHAVGTNLLIGVITLQAAIRDRTEDEMISVMYQFICVHLYAILMGWLFS